MCYPEVDGSDFGPLIGKTVKDIVHRRWETVFYWDDGTETHLVGTMEGIFIDEDPPEPYDGDFGDNKLCECGHPYYRHFDTYDDMRPVGCKYCWPDPCYVFIEAKPKGEEDAS